MRVLFFISIQISAAVTLSLPSHAQALMSDADTKPVSLLEISVNTGMPYRAEDFTSQWQTQRWASRFTGLEGAWSPVWDFQHNRHDFAVSAPLISLQATAEETVGRLGIRTPSGWVVLAEQGGGTVGRYASERRFLLVGHRTSSVTQRLRLWSLPDETDSSEQSTTHTKQAFHVDTAWDSAGLKLQYQDVENLHLSGQIGGLTWSAEQFIRHEPSQTFSTDAFTVALSYASLHQRVLAIAYSGRPLPNPVQAFGAGLGQWEWESVTRIRQDEDTARVRFNGRLDTRWGWIKAQTPWFDSQLRLLWLSTETMGTVSSNSFPSLSDDLSPLAFTDALLGSIRLTRQWALGEQAHWGVWAEQWIPVTTWGTGSRFNATSEDDESTQGQNGDPQPTDDASIFSERYRYRPFSGLYFGVFFRL